VPLNSTELLVRLDQGGRQPLRVRLTMALRDVVRTGQVSCSVQHLAMSCFCVETRILGVLVLPVEDAR